MAPAALHHRPRSTRTWTMAVQEHAPRRIRGVTLPAWVWRDVRSVFFFFPHYYSEMHASIGRGNVRTAAYVVYCSHLQPRPLQRKSLEHSSTMMVHLKLQNRPWYDTLIPFTRPNQKQPKPSRAVHMSARLRSYKRGKGTSNSVEEQFSTPSQNRHATSKPSLRSSTHSLTAQQVYKHSHHQRTRSMSHHDINTGTAKPAS